MSIEWNYYIPDAPRRQSPKDKGFLTYPKEWSIVISTEKQEAKAMLKNYKSEDDKLDKKERKARIETLRARMVSTQQTVLEAKIPVIVLVEGWDSAGKGNLIN